MLYARFSESKTFSCLLFAAFFVLAAGHPSGLAASDGGSPAGSGQRKSKGHIGPDLADGEWRFGGSRDELFASIASGRPGGMPPFSKSLAVDEIWAIISYIQGLKEGQEGAKEKRLVDEGKTVYLENCSVCHGKDAQGAVGPNLVAEQKWKYGSTEADMFESISVGRPGGMHGWRKYLGDEQIWKLIAYLKSISQDGSGADQLAQRAALGKSTYLHNCSACHGPNGEGRSAPSLVDRDWIYGGTDKNIYESISQGRHTGKMPRFEESLGKEKLWDVVAFIRSLSQAEEGAKIKQTVEKGEKLYALKCSVCHGKDIRSYPVAPPPFSEGIFPCSECHADMETNRERRQLEEFHENIELTHAEGQRWCLDCHDGDNRDMLSLVSGEKIPFSESYRLCGQCHGDKYRDWRAGVHGKRTGMWDGQKEYLLCAHCHNPHSPRFKPLVPMPPPVRPEDIR